MLAGAIYVHRISDRRFTGIGGRNFNIFRELCGERALGSVVLVTNMWSAVSREVGEAREGVLSADFFKPVLKKGAQMFRHFDTPESAHGAIRKIIAVGRQAALQIQWELVVEQKSLVNTSAGKALKRELEERLRQYEAEFKRVWEEMEQALMEKDEVARKELEEETKRLQEEMRRIKEDAEGMDVNYDAENQRMDARMSIAGREEADAEYKRRLADLNRRLRQAPASARC